LLLHPKKEKKKKGVGKKKSVANNPECLIPLPETVPSACTSLGCMHGMVNPQKNCYNVVMVQFE
jgi:hypothetical protein